MKVIRFFVKSRVGISLVELLLVMTLLGIVFAILSIFFTLPTRNTQFAQNKYQIFEEMRRIIEVLRNELTLSYAATTTSQVPSHIGEKELVFYGSNDGFYVVTHNNRAKISDANITCVFQVYAVQTNPPKPKQMVEIELENDSLNIEFKTKISLLNSAFADTTFAGSGTVLIIKKN